MQISQLVQTLSSEYELNGTPLENDRLHVSLLGLGDYIRFPAGLVRWAQHRTSHFKFRPFTVGFDRVSSLRGRSAAPRRCAIALRDSSGGPQMKNLQRAIANRFGVVPRQGFTPHVTLLYDSQYVAEKQIDKVTWEVREFALIHSRINRGRLQAYSLVERFPLLSV